ncbi:hypothetical protein OPV22_003661 [Ensete ventricosum]|uniref:Uncharacterized protein n=1 Tax=Ensete ventricosum TaxID=4639 RepID=A0AAV8S173_ENSVE|nr:hypothetical protein OPV22_003661 [Ensete ventricosum]
MAAVITGARRALANRSISSAAVSIVATLRASPSSSPSVRAFARLPRGRLPFGVSRSPVELDLEVGLGFQKVLRRLYDTSEE